LPGVHADPEVEAAVGVDPQPETIAPGAVAVVFEDGLPSPANLAGIDPRRNGERIRREVQPFGLGDANVGAAAVEVDRAADLAIRRSPERIAHERSIVAVA